MNKIGLVIGGFGLLLLFGGLAMPATQTHTSTTCVDTQYQVGNGCVQTNYSTPNFGRGVFIALGLALSIGGVVASFSFSDLSAGTSITGMEGGTQDHSDAEKDSNSLHAQIKQRQKEQDGKHSDDE